MLWSISGPHVPRCATPSHARGHLGESSRTRRARGPEKAPGRCPGTPPRGSASGISAKGRGPLGPIYLGRWERRADRDLETCRLALLSHLPNGQIAKGLALCWRSRRQSLLAGSRAAPSRFCGPRDLPVRLDSPGTVSIDRPRTRSEETMATKSKEVGTFREAVADIRDGSTIAFGGFAKPGVPYNLIQELLEQETKRRI